MTPRALWSGRALALLGILLVALSLRVLTGAASPIYSLIAKDFPLPDIAIAILGSLAPFAFAIASMITPRLGRKIGIEWGLVLALTLITGSHLIRAAAPEWLTLAIGTGFGLVGIGIGNVLLPPAVKKYFPDRIGLVTTLYVGLVAVSSGIAPLFAHPMSDTIGWRNGFIVWAGATAVALVPWLLELWRTRGAATPLDTLVEPRSRLKLRTSPTAMAIAFMLAISSINGYVVFAWLPPLMMGTSGVGPAEAGLMLATFGFIGLPVSLLTPILASRIRRTDYFLYASTALFVVGYAGLLTMPSLPWLWLVLLSIGPLIFPLTLVLINLRTKSTQASMQLSGFVQVIAYSIAIVGPLGAGLLHEATGSWTSVLVLLLINSVLLLLLAPVLGRGKFVEDEVR
jgi:CP family cyanate transporter-like MFS transporter